MGFKDLPNYDMKDERIAELEAENNRIQGLEYDLKAHVAIHEKWQERAEKAEAELKDTKADLITERENWRDMNARWRKAEARVREVQGFAVKDLLATLEDCIEARAERDAALDEVEFWKIERLGSLERLVSEAALKDKMLGDCGDAIKMWCDLVKKYYDVGREIVDMWDGKEGACVEIRVIEKLRAVLGDA